MLKAIARIENESKREAIATTVSNMAEARERKDGSFTERYQQFIATAADHMTVLAPFLPALSKLL